MNLKEIQERAEQIREKRGIGTMGLDYDVFLLAGLIADLAARMQELVVNEQGVCSPMESGEVLMGAKEVPKMTRHSVTVDYCSSVDVNMQIEANINAAFGGTDMELDYLRITSDRDGE